MQPKCKSSEFKSDFTAIKEELIKKKQKKTDLLNLNLLDLKTTALQ